MDNNIDILFIGGDGRQIVAENIINELGWNTSVCLNSKKLLARGKNCEDWKLALKKKQVILFPLPLTKDGVYLNCDEQNVSLADVFSHIQPRSLVLGGSIPEKACYLLKEKEIRWIDYYTEALQIDNALLTAESAIGISLLEMPITLSGAKCFVVGYGRIGKILSIKLQLLGADVTVGARKSVDLAFAKAYGHDTVSIQNGVPNDRISDFDVIFNTVPVRLFDESVLTYLKHKALYIELASAPYGIDAKQAQENGIRIIQAQALPGKYSPISAGHILAEHVVRILSKEDITP